MSISTDNTPGCHPGLAWLFALSRLFSSTASLSIILIVISFSTSSPSAGEAGLRPQFWEAAEHDYVTRQFYELGRMLSGRVASSPEVTVIRFGAGCTPVPPRLS